MTSAPEVPRELAAYLHALVEAMAAAAPVEAVYLLGSAALGAYDQHRSDVDVVAVTRRSLSLDERRALAAAAEGVQCPARKLELVVYPRGSTAWEVNLNTGEHVSFDPADEPEFWFVLDRAIAEQHALPLEGPPWAELFEPESRPAIETALEQALAFGGWESPRDAELAAARGRIWRETGRWVSKQEAAAGVPA